MEEREHDQLGTEKSRRFCPQIPTNKRRVPLRHRARTWALVQAKELGQKGQEQEMCHRMEMALAQCPHPLPNLCQNLPQFRANLK